MFLIAWFLRSWIEEMNINTIDVPSGKKFPVEQRLVFYSISLYNMGQMFYIPWLSGIQKAGRQQWLHVLREQEA